MDEVNELHSIGLLNVGQPQLQKNFASLLNSFELQTTHLYIPGDFSFTYFPEKGLKQ